MFRELVLDTETTGLDPEDGHRLVEIGIVELENHIPTGNYFHYYLNPERDSDYKAEQVHGLSKEFLKNKDSFKFALIDEILKNFEKRPRNVKALVKQLGVYSELIECQQKKDGLKQVRRPTG